MVFAAVSVSPQLWGGVTSLKASRILYSHSFPVWLGQNLDKPESFGFLREVIQSLVEASLLLTIAQFTGNQITKLSIPVEGGSNVFAWLVTPLKLYAEHEAAFRDDSADSSFQPNQALAVQKLAEDPDSRLIIYCKLLGPIQTLSAIFSEFSLTRNGSPRCKFAPVAV
jgi:hypothetical protein